MEAGIGNTHTLRHTGANFSLEDSAKLDENVLMRLLLSSLLRGNSKSNVTTVFNIDSRSDSLDCSKTISKPAITSLRFAPNINLSTWVKVKAGLSSLR